VRINVQIIFSAGATDTVLFGIEETVKECVVNHVPEAQRLPRRVICRNAISIALFTMDCCSAILNCYRVLLNCKFGICVKHQWLDLKMVLSNTTRSDTNISINTIWSNA